MPLDQAQVNVVERMLERFGELPTPTSSRAAPLGPGSARADHSRCAAFRELEPPADDEGFAAVERVPFERLDGRTATPACSSRPLRSVARDGRGARRADRTAPHLVFDWRPDGDERRSRPRAVAAVADVVSGTVEAAICPHPGGAPICWCRIPLPGLRSPLRIATGSTSRAPPWSARVPRTERSRMRSARGTSRLDRTAAS